jgi:hypothetical protein
VRFSDNSNFNFNFDSLKEQWNFLVDDFGVVFILALEFKFG